MIFEQNIYFEWSYMLFIMYLYLQNIVLVNFNPWFVVKHFDSKFQIFASQYML
jgi:hypothetical protein